MQAFVSAGSLQLSTGYRACGEHLKPIHAQITSKSTQDSLSLLVIGLFSPINPFVLMDTLRLRCVASVCNVVVGELLVWFVL